MFTFEADKIGLAIYDRTKDKVVYLMAKHYPQHFYGTGDILTAILSSAYFRGISLEKSGRLALDFLNEVMMTTLALERDLRYGLCYEPHLLDLIKELSIIIRGEKMKKEELRRLIEVSLFAALILVSVQFLRIQVGPQFVHLGNALVVIAVLVFGSGFGALAAALGLGLFDIFNGYAAEVWITILESLLVCYVLHLVYEKAMKANDKPATIFTVGLIAAVTKIILNLFKYTLINSFIGGLALLPAMVGALAKITGTFGTSIVTIVAVPILYPIFKRIVQGKK